MKIHLRIDQDTHFFCMLMYNKRPKGTTNPYRAQGICELLAWKHMQGSAISHSKQMDTRFLRGRMWHFKKRSHEKKNELSIINLQSTSFKIFNTTMKRQTINSLKPCFRESYNKSYKLHQGFYPTVLYKQFFTSDNNTLYDSQGMQHLSGRCHS